MNLAGIMDYWRDLDSTTRLRCGYVFIAILAVLVGWSFLSDRASKLESKRKAREAVLKELMPLKATYLATRTSSDRLAGKVAAVRPDESLARIVEETGIKGKGVKITQIKGDDKGPYLEDAAEVKVEGITANEAVNLLFRLEKGSRPLVMKKANIRVRFDDSSRLDLSLSLALLKPSAVPGK